MTPTVAIDDLRIGMFIHLDLGWWAHPFPLSSFMVTSAEQLATLRGLGLSTLRWSPEKSRLDEPGRPAAEVHVLDPSAAAPGRADTGVDGALTEAAELPQSPADLARARHRDALAEQRAAEQQCQRQLAEARAGWLHASRLVQDTPEQAAAVALGLTQAVLDKLMVDQEMCVRVLSDTVHEPDAEHALNVMVISLLMGRVFGLDAQAMQDLGLGALLHDIGKLDLPERARRAEAHDSPATQALYRSHVELGLAHGQRMGLAPGALQVLAQHHELADGSGFPQALRTEGIALPARIVALVNRYDNLCNPRQPALACTPHEALSLIFAQSRSKFEMSMLNAFIRMMGVYPPGSLVQLTDENATPAW